MNLKQKLLVASLVLGFSQAAVAADPHPRSASVRSTGGSAPMGVSMRDGVKLAHR